MNAIASLCISVFLIMAVFAYPTLKQLFKKEPDSDKLKVKAARVINYSQLSAPPPIALEQPEPETLKAVPKVKTVKFLQPVAKKDEEVPDDIEVPTMEEMEHSLIGTENQEGVDSIVVDVDFTIELPPEPAPPSRIFSIVEQMPLFRNGDADLLAYLGDNVEYPQVAKEHGIEGTVYVQFVVETDGTVSSVTVVRGVHYSLDKEAARAVSEMPSWKPGSQNNQPVRVQFVIPIQFDLR